MANEIPGRYVPTSVPGATLTSEDIARITPDDWKEIRDLARGYCRTVDAARSRKRMDGSATVVRDGHAPYGTDDVSDDVTQDAVLMFAQRLRDITAKCQIASTSTPDDPAWIYVRRDGSEMIVTRTTLKRWAVRDAAARNGYRADLPAAQNNGTHSDQPVSAPPQAETLTRAVVASGVAQNSEAIFRTAYGDGRDFPVLARVYKFASQAEDLGRAGVLASVAQEMYGGSYGSRWNVIKVRDAARAEWSDLSARLDDARDTMIYRGTESAGD
ncbi:hypothetical protein C1I98_29000 [Spongiactinospora gelatinilytica]|uniref:Uncharacterized protein n=1 Tax=Spongiactinospora gelatinilytica TaxID=2666298 RepID=A0A2W2FX64_9ACTN|nr:hypothetical protein [Spongiactinospora gelatinilytica]PZG33035.1 hypothetical protein C1I98_29000 [Spongiactinospora gelatinilytica]